MSSSSRLRRIGKGPRTSPSYRYLLGDYAPYIYRTDDYGKTWKRLTDGKNGIPADSPTRVVREDPDREGLLYAGTEFGMFISFDNGGHWQPFQLNLPNVPITDIKVHRKDLVVSTQGRAFWILDNLSALHQTLAADDRVRRSSCLSRATAIGRASRRRARAGHRVLPAGVVPRPVTIESSTRRVTVVKLVQQRRAGAVAGGRGGRGRAGAAAARNPDDPDAVMAFGRTPGGGDAAPGA